MQQITLDAVELPPGEKAFLSLQLPAGFVIVLEPVTHAAQFINVAGESTQERQNVTLVYNDLSGRQRASSSMRPGTIRLSLENRTAVRALPTVWVVDDKFLAAVGKRRPFLTAKRVLSNADISRLYRTDTSTSTSASRSPASPSCSPTSRARPSSTSGSATWWLSTWCASTSAP